MRLLTIALFCCPLAGLAAEDSRNTQIPSTDTHFALRTYRSREEWEARKAQLRKQILSAAGLFPMPVHSAPPHAEVFGRLVRNGYTIEKVLLETLPGYYVGGNLYRPLDASVKHPVVLHPHGHWPYGRLENEPLDSSPSFGISLARQGFVVFAWDMVGYNDTTQTPHRFESPAQQLWSFGPLGLQLWNSVRALDFVSSLPDVDAQNVGMAGPSGGATQTLMLSAVDDRVKFAAPANMVSTIMQGGDTCENAPGLRIDTNNVEIAAMFAPRPLLLVSATGDWTRNTPQVEFPAIQQIYALYGAHGNVETLHVDAPHNFNQVNRERVYRFFNKRMLGQEKDFAEHNVPVEMLQDMLALSGRTPPANAVDYEGVFAAWKRLTAPVSDAVARERLGLAIPVAWPQAVTKSGEGEHLELTRDQTGERVPARWFPGSGTPVLVVHAAGAAAALQDPEVAKLRAAKRSVLAIDAFQTGSAVAARDRSARHFLAFNVSDAAGRVQDIVTALAYLRENGSGAVELLGIGDGALWSAVAAAVSPESVRLTHVPAFDQIGEEQLLRVFPVAGLQRAGGLAAIQQLLRRQ